MLRRSARRPLPDPDDLQHLEAVFGLSDLAVVCTAGDGRVTRWSDGAHRIYGYASDEIEGRPILLIVPPERHDEARQLIERVRRGQHVGQHETVRVTKHGATIDVVLSMSPVRDAAGQVVGTCTIERDITSQRWMASTLETTLEALETALNAAKESEARGQRFLADAAHQLRAPIAGVQACAAALAHGASPEKQEELLAYVLAETSRAGRLIKGLLYIARLDQGEIRAAGSCDLLAICSHEADQLRVLAPDLNIVVASAGALNDGVECDVDAVREILVNLLDNARRHASAAIEVSVGNRSEMVEVRVLDDGPGIPEPLRERVFERFVSLDGRGGSGLGLPIARGLAMALGGSLNYEGGGFLLRLPRRPRSVSGPWGGQVAPPLLNGS